MENIVYIAIRDIDPDEWRNLKKLKIKCFTMDHVTQLGIGEVLDRAIQYLDPVGDKHFHISFDIDAIDPEFAFGTGTKFRGGLNSIQSNQIIRTIAHRRHLVGLDIMEINPSIELEEGRVTFRGEELFGLVSPTVGLGLDLINSIFTEYFSL
jgi:arginase